MEHQHNVLKALADESRLRLISLFLKSDQALCVCELVDALKLPQYAVSKALNILKNAGLLLAEKQGLWVYYRLNHEVEQNRLLFPFLAAYLNEKQFSDDDRKLQQRLLLRESERCVVGIVPESELMELILEKSDREAAGSGQ